MIATHRQISRHMLQGSGNKGLGTFGKVIVGAGITAVAISIGLFFLAPRRSV
jgi:hypothetical protein